MLPALCFVIAVASSCGNHSGAIVLLSPANGDTAVYPEPTLKWKGNASDMAYRLQVSLKPDFSTIEYDSVWNANAKELPMLDPGQTFYWRIRAEGAHPSTWSNTWKFRTASIFIPKVGSTFTIQFTTEGAAQVVSKKSWVVTSNDQTVLGRDHVTSFALYPSQGLGDELSPSDFGSAQEAVNYIQYMVNGDVAIGNKADSSWRLLPLTSEKQKWYSSTEFVGDKMIESRWSLDTPNEGSEFHWLPSIGFFTQRNAKLISYSLR